VAIYVGSGQIIHAPQAGDVVRYASVDVMGIAGATRPG
jgi:cell wall-associated NlpC family hydrolase